MHKVMQGALIAAILIFVASSTVGCGLTGYAIGGAIDPTKSALEVDSVSVTKEVDSAGVEHRYLEEAHVRALLTEASPTRGSMVEILTQKGSFKGSALIVDTVLALRRERAGRAGEDLLPGDSVAVTLGDSNMTHVKGRVLGFRQGYIVLLVGGWTRVFPLSLVNVVHLSDERAISGRDLSSPFFSDHLTRVPGFVLGPEEEFPRSFVPLHDVEQIRVARRVRWGTTRTIGYAVGGVCDIAFFCVLAGPHHNGDAILRIVYATFIVDVLPILLLDP